MKSFFTSIGAIFMALSASTCCVGPLLAIAGSIGVSASYLIWLSSIKNYLIAGSLLAIGYNLYRAYFPKKTTDCCPLYADLETQQPPVQSEKQSKIVAWMQSKTFLWSVVIFTLVILGLPYIIN